VGWPVTEAVRTAIATLLKRSWSPAIETDGEPREGADVAELTGLLDYWTCPPGRRACASSCGANDPTPVHS
jgi:hypothetical protein